MVSKPEKDASDDEWMKYFNKLMSEVKTTTYVNSNDIRKFNLVGGTVFYGPEPEIDDLYDLLDKGVTTIWDLAPETNVVTMETEMFPNVVVTNIKDFGIPDLQRFIHDTEYVSMLVKNGAKTFVHCHAGIGRTGMALAALAMSVDGVNANEALRRVKSACGGPDTKQQANFIKYIEKFF